MLRNPGVSSPRTRSTTATKAANRTPPQQKRNTPRNTDTARHLESSNERVTIMPTPVSAPVHAKSRKASKHACQPISFLILVNYCFFYRKESQRIFESPNTLSIIVSRFLASMFDELIIFTIEF